MVYIPCAWFVWSWVWMTSHNTPIFTTKTVTGLPFTTSRWIKFIYDLKCVILQAIPESFTQGLFTLFESERSIAPRWVLPGNPTCFAFALSCILRRLSLARLDCDSNQVLLNHFCCRDYWSSTTAPSYLPSETCRTSSTNWGRNSLVSRSFI